MSTLCFFFSQVSTANHTLEPEANSLVLTDLIANASYSVAVAAYNRQGIGPFSDPPAKLVLDPAAAVFPTDILLAGGDRDLDLGRDPGGSNLDLLDRSPGMELVAKEVWIVILASFLVVALLVGFSAVVCFRRVKTDAKQLGHYNGEFETSFFMHKDIFVIAFGLVRVAVWVFTVLVMK